MQERSGRREETIMTKSFILEVQKEDGSDELLLQFPEELMRELDWREGDVLSWSESGEGKSLTVSVENVSLVERKAKADSEQEAKLFEVQVIITHRVRYAVRAGSTQEAIKAVSMEGCEVQEFDQNCLGTQVVGCREVSEVEYLADPGHVGPESHRRALIHEPAQPGKKD